ncbi:hypothetical protein pipiens_018715, partial [Culex pipiens pipiens]
MSCTGASCQPGWSADRGCNSFLDRTIIEFPVRIVEFYGRRQQLPSLVYFRNVPIAAIDSVQCKLEAELEKDKPKLIKRSALIAAKYGAASNDSEDTSKGKTAITKPKKDNAPPVTFTTRYGKAGVAREKSREPSPATRTNSSTNLTPNRAKARDPSPAGGAVANKIRSRDPSPAVETRRAGYSSNIASKLTPKETPTTNDYRRQPSNTLNSFLQNRARSRDPSPTVRTRTSREPSPAEPKRTLKPFTSARSRDPSPATPRTTTTARTINRSRDPSPAEPKKFSSSITIKPTIRSRDPSPAESKKIPLFTSSKLRSRDPSPAGSKLSSYSSTTPRTRTRDPSPAGGKQTSTYGRTLTSKDKPAESRSLTLPTRKTRDASPSVSNIRSRDPSPAHSTTRRSSREPSPTESIREKYGLNSTTYRPYGRTSSNSIGTSSSRISMNSSPVPTSPIGGMALSYMTSNEAIAARTSRPSSRLVLNSQSREVSQCPSPLLIRSQIFSPEPPTVQIVETDDKKEDEDEEESETSTETETSEEESSEETESSVEPEPKIFMEITLVTRATSPTPPGSTPYIRARRAEMCKTIEKTIQKQILNVQTADKAIQSDRMDDSTKYLRYNQPSNRTWSPFLDTKFSSSASSGYTRYSSASSRYSRDSTSRETSVCSTRSDVPEKKEEKISTLAARVKEMSLSKSASPKGNAASSRSSTSTPSIKQKTPPKQKSPEKPPPAPMKDGSPAKSMTAFNSRVNKDFRKSALNMGPAPDRPRKGSSSSSKSSSSTSSSSTATQTTEPAQQNGSRIPQAGNRTSASPCRRSDRASSTSSDASSSTATSSSSTESDGTQTRSTAAASTDEPNANNELLMRAIQLATNFVQNNNRNHTSWFENGSAVSVPEIQPPQEGKTGWEAGTHYMESIKDDDSSDEEDEEGSGSGSGPLQKASWWNNDDGFVKHPPVQAVTMQEEPAAKSYTYRIRPVQSGEKAWWMTEESEKTEEGSEVTDEVAEANDNGSTALYSPFKPILKAESGEKPWWMTDTGEASSNGYGNGENQSYAPYKPIRVTRVESGEKAWWMMSTDNVPAKGKSQESSLSKSASREASKEVSPEKKGPGFTVYTLEAEDEAWWQQAMAELEKKDKSSSSASSSRAPSKEPTPEPRQQGFIVTRAESGEKAWWMYSEEKANEEGSSDSSVKECSPVKAKPFKITHIASGEAPWWMTDEGNLSRSGSKSNVVSRSNSFNNSKSNAVSRSNSFNNSKSNAVSRSNSFNNSKQQSPTKYRITRVESGERANWMDSPEEKSVSPQKLTSLIEQHGEEEDHHHHTEMDLDEEIQSIGKFVAGLPQFPTGESTIELLVETPLGDRASPEGVEDCKQNRSSPYDNIPQSSNNNSATLEPRPYQLELNQKPAEPALFISRHTNIDDLLGGSCHPLSPMMDRMFVMDDLMEISPHDVRVHDSTAQFIHGGGSGEDGSLRKAG